MFYKNNYKPEDKQFIKDNPLEFALSLLDKIKHVDCYTPGFLKYTYKDKELLIPIIYSSKDMSYLSENGELTNSSFMLNLKKREDPDLLNIEVVPGKLNTLSYNQSIKSKIDFILEDFFNLKNVKKIVDKNNESYEIKIVKNADASIGAELIVDTLFLFHQEKLIGYLKVKYCTEEVLKKMDKKPEDSAFFKIAGVDYSFIEDNYKNKGLGYAMYFHMAQYLESEGIDFRQSTLQSSYAERLWAGIEKNWSEHIEKKTFSKTNCSFLKMTQDLELYFKDNNPKIRSVLKV